MSFFLGLTAFSEFAALGDPGVKSFQDAVSLGVKTASARRLSLRQILVNSLRFLGSCNLYSRIEFPRSDRKFKTTASCGGWRIAKTVLWL